MSFDPSLYRNESEVESKLIVSYLLPKLGYSPDSWYQEVAFGSIRLDFLAFATQVLPFVLGENSPLSIIMEAKSPKQNLDKHVPKFRRYLTSLNVVYGVLTNGKEIRIYERVLKDIRLIFTCQGHEVEEKFQEIKEIIGKDILKDRIQINVVESTTTDDLKLTVPQKQFEVNKESSMKVIAVYHHKGGVGKTTVAINLAAALRNKGKRVLLIDIDAQANTTFATGLVKFQFEDDDDLKSRNVYHLLDADHDLSISDVMRESNFFNNPEINVIPSHITLISGQQNLVTFGPSRTKLTKKLEVVKSDYDIVIIDTPPSLDLYASAALTAADYLIIPSDLKPFSNQGLTSVKQFIKKEVNYNRENLGKPNIEILGVLPSKISTNPRYLQHIFPKHKSIIPQRYDLFLMESVIYERMSLSHCVNKTITVGDMELPDPKSIFDFALKETSANQSAIEFESLATEVLNKIGVNE